MSMKLSMLLHHFGFWAYTETILLSLILEGENVGDSVSSIIHVGWHSNFCEWISLKIGKMIDLTEFNSFVPVHKVVRTYAIILLQGSLLIQVQFSIMLKYYWR